MADARRERLIQRIRRLPAEMLRYVEELLTDLDRGDDSRLASPQRAVLAESTLYAEQSAVACHGVHQSGDESPHSKDWPHAPLHRLIEHGTYIVTAGTLHKEHWFRRPESLDLLESALLRLAKRFGWQLEAWAVFSNHYHFVAHAWEGAKDLRTLLKQLHGETSHELNVRDRASGRSVWHNFWDTELTFEKSYLARLSYVHQNPVKHGLVPVANQYRWCSAAWFERTSTPAQVKTIYSFKTDQVRVHDDFEVV
jgi:putative transposase